MCENSMTYVVAVMWCAWPHCRAELRRLVPDHGDDAQVIDRLAQSAAAAGWQVDDTPRSVLRADQAWDYCPDHQIVPAVPRG
jgi:hypothetical protein